MTPEQDEHLRDVLAAFSKRAEEKYRAGAAEHGGNVWDNVTLDELEDELIDAYIYLRAWRKKLALVKAKMKKINIDEVLKR